MLDETNIPQIRGAIEEFLHNMTITPIQLLVTLSPVEPNEAEGEKKKLDVINVEIAIDDPQFLIGQNGQTLLELERMLRIILNKKLQEHFYLSIDINNYKSKKIEYLKSLAKDSASQVLLTKEKKALAPMSAYERRVIHKELDGRQDIITSSEGEGDNRHIVISPTDSL